MSTLSQTNQQGIPAIETKEALQPEPRRPLFRYFVLAYLMFWVLLGATGGAMALHPPASLVTILKNVCAWAPTIVIALQFKRFYPGLTPAQYFKRNFLSKVNPAVFLWILLLQSVVFGLAVTLRLVSTGASIASVPLISLSSLLPTFLITLTSGPMGEELGWRGFALGELKKRFTPFAAALILGVIWGFWHAPLWFISGYAGIQLVAYSLFFLVAIVSLSVVMAFFYNRCRNILIPMWIHFLFNFPVQLTQWDPLHVLGYLAAGYLIVAAILVVYDRKNFFPTPS